METEELIARQKQECIFCHIVAGKVGSRKIYEDERLIVILDINPANPGHMLVMPKEHYSVLPQLPEDDVARIGFVVKALSQACLKALGARGTTIFAANGIAAGQRASHFMIHIIPRHPNDNVKIMLPEEELAKEELENCTQKLKAIFSQISGMPTLQQETNSSNNPKGETKNTAVLNEVTKFLLKKGNKNGSM